jgi:hypothetical protein
MSVGRRSLEKNVLNATKGGILVKNLFNVTPVEGHSLGRKAYRHT